MARRRRRSSSTSSTDDSFKPLFPALQVNYAKRKKSESTKSILIQTAIVFTAIAFCAYTYFFFEHFHFHITHFFATKWDDHHSQHSMGHKLLKNHTDIPGAFQWFRKSSDKGHPHSAYNLAAGHLSGFRTDVRKGEVRQLLRFAAKNGVEEAKQLLRTLCKEKPAHCDL